MVEANGERDRNGKMYGVHLRRNSYGRSDGVIITFAYATGVVTHAMPDHMFRALKQAIADMEGGAA